jgi:ABC-2 type transport system permease protein
LISLGKMQFVVSIPLVFSRRLLRGERSALLLTADATELWPMAAVLVASLSIGLLRYRRTLE